MAVKGILMVLMVLEAGVSPWYRLNTCSLGLLIDCSAPATIWIAMPVDDIFVCPDEHCAACQAFLAAWM